MLVCGMWVDRSRPAALFYVLGTTGRFVLERGFSRWQSLSLQAASWSQRPREWMERGECECRVACRQGISRGSRGRVGREWTEGASESDARRVEAARDRAGRGGGVALC